ncbi:MAG: hypothetical protein VCB42_07725, partial [Myxococcota bacterium]
MGRRFQQNGGSRVLRWHGSLSTAFVLLVLMPITGCLSTEGPPQEAASSSEGVVVVQPGATVPERPDAAPDYDVLVGEFAAIDGDYRVAHTAFMRAAEKDPASAHLQRRLAELSAKRFDLDGASRHARRAMELDPEHEDTRIFLGRMYRNMRDLTGAREVLLLEDDTLVSSAAGLLLFQMYLERNQLPEALSLADKILEKDAADLGGHMAAATVHERMGNLAE